MGDNWDDDDFEPEVESLAPPPAPVDEPLNNPPVNESVTGPGKDKPKYMQKEGKMYAMEDLGRELTASEREEIQRRSDRKFARDLMGLDDVDDEDDSSDWKNVMTKEEFESWGDRMSKYFAQRHKASHYGDFLSKLLAGLSADLDATEIRKMSNLLKTIADDKKKETDKTKGTGAAKGGKKAKPNLKANASKGAASDLYDDFGGGGAGWRNDDDDDFM